MFLDAAGWLRQIMCTTSKQRAKKEYPPEFLHSEIENFLQQFTAVRVISAEVGQLAGACVCAASSRVPTCLPERRLKAVEASGHANKIFKTRLGIPPAAGSQRTGLLSSPPTNVNGQITPNVNGTFSSSSRPVYPLYWYCSIRLLIVFRATKNVCKYFNEAKY